MKYSTSLIGEDLVREVEYFPYTGSLDVYVTCFSDEVDRVPDLGFRVWAYVVGRALFYWASFFFSF